MKHAFRLLALVLALALSLSVFTAFAEEAADPVLFTFDGEEITLSQVDYALYSMYQNGYVEDASDYDSAIQALIQNKVILAKIAELGLDQFTAEEEAALMADAEAEWQEALDLYVSYFLAEDTPEARAACYEEAELYYAMYGYDVNALFESYKTDAAYDKLEQYILETNPITVSDEEITATFREFAESDQQMYEGNIFYYEYYVLYYGYDSWYIPDGYRGIIHILLNVDEELLTAYSDAQALYEETPTDENKAAVDAAKAAILASKQDVIDEIYARLEKGEAFTALIAAYGEDPGMENEVNLNNGYQVHPESVVWDPAFVEGAFSEKMQQPGDVSDPVIGSYGIHILYYLRDIPGGIVPLDTEIYDYIKTELENLQENSVLSAMVTEWTASHDIVYFEDAIAAAKATSSTQE